MPRRLGHFVISLAAVLLAINFVGCRATSNRLAGVPGLGWLEHSDEGWADFEPAPGLPKPSVDSEPTVGNSASSIASKSGMDSNRSSPFGVANSSALAGSGSRFEGSSASNLKGSQTRSGSSSYGSYASAYGKYGPPQKSQQASIGPQNGPYDVNVPNYAAKGSADTYAVNGPKFDSNGTAAPDNTTPSSFDNRFDNSAISDGRANPTYTASSNSRFGVSAASGQTASPSTTYTPPGFVKPSSPSTGPSSPSTGPSRFGSPSQLPAGAAAQPSADRPGTGSRFGGYSSTPANSTKSFTPPRFDNSMPSSSSATVQGYNPSAATTAASGSPPAGSTSRFGVRPSPSSQQPAAGSANPAATGSLGPQFGQARAAAVSSPTSSNAAGSESLPRGDFSLPPNGSSGRPSSGAYPATSTPDPFVIGRGNRGDASAPSLGGAGLQGPGAPGPASSESRPPSVQRSPTPFRPGSTSTYQGATTVRKPSVELAAHHSNLSELDHQLVLAVGDRYQFPRMLR